MLIPGLGTPPVDTWPFCLEDWLQSFLPANIDQARPLAFDYSVPLTEAFSWDSFLVQGGNLLNALAEVRKNGELNEVSLCSSHPNNPSTHPMI